MFFYYGDKNITYNGQDYKSTIYKLGSENKEETNKNILELSENKRCSDARDDETRRLEVMEYSLEIYNKIAEILYIIIPFFEIKINRILKH